MSEKVPLTHQPIDRPKGIAVFLCGCGGAISSKVSLDVLKEAVISNPDVKSVEVMNRCCSLEDLNRMRLSLLSGEVDRFVVAGCSYKTTGEKFSRLAAESGIDRSLVEICNVREQCTLPHPPKEAEEKAKRLLAVSLTRCQELQPTPRSEAEAVSGAMLVIGNGYSSIAAAREAISLGHDVILACPDEKLALTSHDDNVINLEESGLESLVGSAYNRLTISYSTHLESLRGLPGNFTATLETDIGESNITVGAVIVAMDEEDVRNPLFDRISGPCIGQHDLAEALIAGEKIPHNVIMLALDISGESAFDPMSTHEAVHSALHLKGLRPKTNVFIITRNVFALGQCEAGYRKAQEVGVVIIRTDRFPELISGNEVVVKDMLLGQSISIPYDLIVLDDMRKVPEMRALAKVLKVPLDVDGRFRRPNAKMKPSSSIREGVYLSGSASERSLAVGPTLEACSAMARASAMLHRMMIRGGDVAEVHVKKCSGCLTCVRSCPFGAPSIGKEWKAEISLELCQGCGICVGACPSKAIQMYSFRDDQIGSQLRSALGGYR